MSSEKKCSGVSIITYEEFDKLHTKQLLAMRHKETDPYFCDYICPGCCARYECEAAREHNYKTLREVLATRPHVLNKQESKALRKQRKKQGK